MRYAQGGGLTDERREFREGIRRTAAERFARDEPSSAIAKDLRVSVRSVQRWRKSWTKGGPRALRSTGSASPPRLSEDQFVQLDAELDRGPMAHGWPDQRWTLTRVKTVIGRRFHQSYTIRRPAEPGFVLEGHALELDGSESWPTVSRVADGIQQIPQQGRVEGCAAVVEIAARAEGCQVDIAVAVIEVPQTGPVQFQPGIVALGAWALDTTTPAPHRVFRIGSLATVRVERRLGRGGGGHA